MPLKEVLKSMLESPSFAEGHVVSRKLAKGLTVKIKLQNDLVVVQLSRDDAMPSKAEWKAIVDCWPEQAFVVDEPQELRPQGARRFLRGKLRQSPRLVE